MTEKFSVKITKKRFVKMLNRILYKLTNRAFGIITKFHKENKKSIDFSDSGVLLYKR